MTDKQWRTAWRILNTARGFPDHQRRVFVESQSADPEIVACVLEMLEDDMLENPSGGPAPAPKSASRSGARLGHYQVAELLGRGGMGEVYAARDTDLDRQVALKFLLPDGVGDPSAVKHFVREAKAASALNHPNILTVYEVVQSSSGLAIAMELVEGSALSELRGSTLPVPQVLEFGRQAASALAAAHALGIVHRDIKPENLMVRPDGLVKVLDFGLARPLAGGAAATGTSGSTGFPAGTLRYMSPEQLRNEPLTGVSDVFSLGIVLYELAAGCHPFEAAYPWETAYAIHMRKAAPPSAANSAIPAWLDHLILSMLQHDPGARPPARDLVAQLARPAGRGHVRLRRTWRYPAIAAAIVLAVGAGVYGVRLKTAALPAAVDPRPPIPLTGMDGLELWPSFSPDGKQIVYARDTGDGKPDLYLKLIGGAPPLRLQTTELRNVDPAWSPDGLQIAFLRQYSDHVGVFIMGALGGAERLVGNVSGPARVERGLTWSPDQKTLIVSDDARAGASALSSTPALWSLPLDGSSRQRLTSPPDHYGDIAPAFSPDGKTLAFIRSTGAAGGELFLLQKPGQERRIATRGSMDSLAWSTDGQSIFFTTRDVHDRSIFRIRLGGGDAVRLSGIAAASPFNITVAGQGNRLAFAQQVPGTSDILKLDITGKNALRKLISSAGFDTDPSFSPDGSRIAFASTRSGISQIWMARSDGSNPLPLTAYDERQSGSPRWSPDGRQLAFDHDLKAGAAVFVMNAAGGAPRELISEANLPAWSPDGRWIYFRSDRTGTKQIWKAPSEGGTPVQMTRNGGFECFPSPEGRFLYYTKDRERAGIWRMPAEGGPETAVPELRPVVGHRYWSGTPLGIYFLDAGATPAALKFFRFANRRVERVLSPVPPTMNFIRGLAVSPDGRQLLWVQLSRQISQILLVEGFR